MKHAILSCNGLDKPEGSVAREVAILPPMPLGVKLFARSF